MRFLQLVHELVQQLALLTLLFLCLLLLQLLRFAVASVLFPTLDLILQGFFLIGRLTTSSTSLVQTTATNFLDKLGLKHSRTFSASHPPLCWINEKHARQGAYSRAPRVLEQLLNPKP